MLNRYLKGFYINILSLIAKVIYWLTIIFSFGEGKLFFIYEEWILFLVYALITWYISSAILKEQLKDLDDDEQNQTFKSELKISLAVLVFITIAQIILMIFLKNYEGIILIIFMNALIINLYRLINKQGEIKSLGN